MSQAQLDEAKAAKHKLLMGQSVARITRDGKTVEYTQANLADLNAYINQLSGSRRAIGIKL